MYNVHHCAPKGHPNNHEIRQKLTHILSKAPVPTNRSMEMGYETIGMDPGDIDHCAFLLLIKVLYFMRQSKNFLKAKMMNRGHNYNKNFHIKDVGSISKVVNF